ncbi:hypothetical protein ACFE04_004445 [Oxalis oulophora]
MGFQLGIIQLYYGGSIIRSESELVSVYEGGEKDEISIDPDEAGYADVRDHLKSKGFTEYSFRVYFKDPKSGLTRLHSDDNSHRLVEILSVDRVVVFYVEHGAGINREYVSFDNWAGSASFKVAESSKKAESLEKGESSKAAAVNEEAIDVGGETDSDSESDGDEETVGLGNLFDGDDDDDDDELQLARSKLNLQKKVRKDSGIDGLLEVLRQSHGVETNLKKNDEVGSKVDLDLDDEAGSEDSYESDLGRAKEKTVRGHGLYVDPVTGKQIMNPGMSSEYVVGEERVTNIGWEQQARPSNRLEWMAMTWPVIHVTPANVVHTGSTSTPAQNKTARKTTTRKTPSQKASTSRASASKVPSRSKPPTSKAPARKAPASKATAAPANKATTTKAPASKAPATKLDMIRRGLSHGKGRKRWSARRRKDVNEWQMGYSASSCLILELAQEL